MADDMNVAQDNEFAAFLQEAFQWTDAETPHNAAALFPGLHPSPQHRTRSSPFGGALFSALTQQQLQQQQPHAWHAWHNTAAGQPLLNGFMPNFEQSAALSAQILQLQAQHHEQLHHHHHHQQQQQQQQHAAVLEHPAEHHQERQQQQQQHVHTLVEQEDPQQKQQQQQQARRRGRPPKQSGQYCQGYGAMLRSRQKKKAEVGPAVCCAWLCFLCSATTVNIGVLRGLDVVLALDGFYTTSQSWGSNYGHRLYCQGYGAMLRSWQTNKAEADPEFFFFSFFPFTWLCCICCDRYVKEHCSCDVFDVRCR
jgi:hypothetical protein